jgi:hypothetical protein
MSEIFLSLKEIQAYENRLNQVFARLKTQGENLDSQKKQIETEMYRTQGAFKFLKTLKEDQERKSKPADASPNIIPLRPPDVPETAEDEIPAAAEVK